MHLYASLLMCATCVLYMTTHATCTVLQAIVHMFALGAAHMATVTSDKSEEGLKAMECGVPPRTMVLRQ